MNCGEHTPLRSLLRLADPTFGLREFGFAAGLLMPHENGIGIRSAELTQADTPAMTGFDRWIGCGKSVFIGRDAAPTAPPPTRIPTLLDSDATDADASGFEPVWHGERLAGIPSSGGYAHRTGRSPALAMIDTALAQPGAALHVDVIGERRPATVIPHPPADATGATMRA